MNNSLVLKRYQRFSDDDFVKAYQSKMRELYNEPIQLIKGSIGDEQKVSSYSDTAILREWWGIKTYQWGLWKSNREILNFLIKDVHGSHGSLFYNNLDYLLPSSYYFYDPQKNSEGSNYLAYLLFQIEANKECSDKEQILFIWLNFHNSVSGIVKPISPEMAEASAISPLMSGVGIYNWWIPGDEKGSFEYFVRGLYRLSNFF